MAELSLFRHIVHILLLLTSISTQYSVTNSFLITSSITTSIVSLPSTSLPFQCKSPSRYGRSHIIMMGQRGKRIKKEIKKERELETPPRIQTPYGPIRFNRPLSICDECAGRGIVRCNVCEGKGVTRATGQRKRNALNVDRVNGSRWTAVETRAGHRHYIVSEIRGSRRKQNLELCMTNSCGPEENRVHLWITEEEIRSKSQWRMGWVTMAEIVMADKGPLIDAKTCFRCKGGRTLKCIECDGMGKTGYYQMLHD